MEAPGSISVADPRRLLTPNTDNSRFFAALVSFCSETVFPDRSQRGSGRFVCDNDPYRFRGDAEWPKFAHKFLATTLRLFSRDSPV